VARRTPQFERHGNPFPHSAREKDLHTRARPDGRHQRPWPCLTGNNLQVQLHHPTNRRLCEQSAQSRARTRLLMIPFANRAYTARGMTPDASAAEDGVRVPRAPARRIAVATCSSRPALPQGPKQLACQSLQNSGAGPSCGGSHQRSVAWGVVLLLALLGPLGATAQATWTVQGIASIGGDGRTAHRRATTQLVQGADARGRRIRRAADDSRSAGLQPEAVAAKAGQSGASGNASLPLVTYEEKASAKELVACINGNQPEHRGTTWWTGMQNIPPYLRVRCAATNGTAQCLTHAQALTAAQGQCA
jgi:hypothetical protein